MSEITWVLLPDSCPPSPWPSPSIFFSFRTSHETLNNFPELFAREDQPVFTDHQAP